MPDILVWSRKFPGPFLDHLWRGNFTKRANQKQVSEADGDTKSSSFSIPLHGVKSLQGHLWAWWAVAKRPLLDSLNHTATVKVAVLWRQFIKTAQRPLKALKGTTRSHGVFVAVRILFVVAVVREMAPKHIDAHTKLECQGVVEPQGCQSAHKNNFVPVQAQLG